VQLLRCAVDKKTAESHRKIFGAQVRRLRERLKWSQDQLAEASQLHRTYISGLERGTRNVSLINIIRLASALRTTPSALLESKVGLQK
jgi:transcriptional regulator with XRE-family HTH domain